MALPLACLLLSLQVLVVVMLFILSWFAVLGPSVIFVSPRWPVCASGSAVSCWVRDKVGTCWWWIRCSGLLGLPLFVSTFRCLSDGFAWVCHTQRCQLGFVGDVQRSTTCAFRALAVAFFLGSRDWDHKPLIASGLFPFRHRWVIDAQVRR